MRSACLGEARDPGRGMAAATKLNGTGYVRFVQLDVTSQANVDAAAEQVAKDFGHLDALVNNAGVNTLTRRHLDHQRLQGGLIEPLGVVN